MDAYSPEDSFLINSLPLNANQFEAGSEALNSVPSILVWNTELNVLQRINTKTNEVLNQFNSGPEYLVYNALLSQSGTDDPVIVSNGTGPNTPLKNTIGNIVWTRLGDGQYRGTLEGAFTDGKTQILTGTPAAMNTKIQLIVEPGNPDIINLNSVIEGSLNGDDVIYYFPFEIRVYN